MKPRTTKQLCAIMILFVSIVFSNINVSASENFNADTLFSGYFSEGYTESGVHYTAFQIIQPDGLISPYLIDFKKVSCNVTFDGNIVPPETWYFTPKYGNITYRGTLYLKSYSFDNFFWSKKTTARYSGTVAAGL